jgi:hypothetical protein
MDERCRHGQPPSAVDRGTAIRLFTVLVAVILIASCGREDGKTAPTPPAAPAAVPASAADPAPAWREPDAPTRAVHSLDGTWLFTPEGYPPRAVPVPCFWEAYPAWPEYPSCPGYLDGTPDEGLDIIEGSNWATRAIRRGTYTLGVAVPDPYPVTRLRFEAIHHGARVFVNDVEVGRHVGPYWARTFDATAGVRAGTNRLRVELTDGSILLGADGVTRWPVGYYALTDITGLYRSVRMESLPAVFAEEPLIVPSVRRGDLTVRHRIVNSTGAAVAVWVTSRAQDDQGVALATRPVRVTVPARGDAEVVVVADWPDPRLWSPVDPHLYTLRTLLQDDDGTPLDLRADRFGFREVWIEDGHYRLNGMRMNLIGDSSDDQASRPRYWGAKYWSCERAPGTLARLRALGMNVVRFHQAPPAECVFDAADESGMLVMPESVVFARLDLLPPLGRHEEYLANAEAWIEAWVTALRNHPSIAMWSVENEMYMYGFALSMDQVEALAEPARAADRIQRPDGVVTSPRPINWDGDSSFLILAGHPVETANWHYPAGDNWTVLPDNEWYDDALAHFAPYLRFDVPTGVGETMDVRRPEWILHTPDQAKAMQGIAVRAMRILGYDDMRPYKLNWAWHDFDPEGREHPWADHYHSLYTIQEKERLLAVLRESYHPIAVFDRDFTRTPSNPDGTFGPVPLPPGVGVVRALILMNDSFLGDRAETVSWEVRDETTGEPLAGGEETVTVPHGWHLQRDVHFRTPAVSPDGPPHELTLTLRARMDGLPLGDFVGRSMFLVSGNPKGRP